LHTLPGGISSKDPSSENDILLYSLLADNRLCSVTALFNIVEPIEKNHTKPSCKPAIVLGIDRY
jgi:hypothetical protein